MPKDNVGRSLSITSQESSYSAVIIADLVAEVQDQSPSVDRKIRDGVHRNSSTRSRKGPHPKKDQTNLAFDGRHTDDSSPQAVVDVESMANGSTDITKGVILNAQLDHKLGSDFLNGGGGKSIEMQEGGKKDLKKEEGEEVLAGLKNMSVLRRIAFAASFLPSIMFVLCFAVILPCHKKMPCIEEVWTITFNNTEVTSGLKFPEGIVFSYFRDGAHGLQWLHQETGITAWDEDLPSSPRFFDCGRFFTNDTQACIVSDPTGTVHYYNTETGERFLRWDPTSGVTGASIPSPPVVLPDCDGDSISEVAVFTSASRMKVLNNRLLNDRAYSELIVELPALLCDTTADWSVPWTTVNGTNLVFRCQNGTEEHLVRISQEKWCSSVKENKGKGEIVILETRISGDLKNSVILPTDDGIIVWYGEEVTKIEQNGQKSWSVTIPGHSSKNRFLLYGKFNKADSQVALFSSDISTSLQMTTLSSETGGTVWNRTVANAEVSDVSLVKGSEKDFVLAVMRKVETDLTKQAVNHISEVTTSILNLLSTEKVEIGSSNVTGSTIIEEITFMELNGELTHTIEEKKMSFYEGAKFTSSVTVIPKELNEVEDLQLIVLRKPTELASDKSSHLKRINVANWDISMSQNKQCIVT